jgi:hypothetical protein
MGTPTTKRTMTTQYLWDGHGIRGSLATVTVKYHGPTNTKGSRWKATVKRDRDTTLSATATFEDGPVAAFNALRRKHVDVLGDWVVAHIGSADMGDTYHLLCTLAG